MNSIKKNRLDLTYKRQLYLLNFILLIGIGTALSLIISIIQNPLNWFSYATVFTVMGLIILVLYYKIDDKLKGISLEIKNLDSL